MHENNFDTLHLSPRDEFKPETTRTAKFAELKFWVKLL